MRTYKEYLDALDENYRMEITPEIHFSNSDIDAENTKVTVPYQIEQEARSWGWKGITITASQTVQLNLILNIGEQENEGTVSVDLSKLKHEKTQGGGVYVAGMYLYITYPSMTVDYTRSYLEVVGES